MEDVVFGISAVARHVPGPVGAWFETRWHWRLRARRPDARPAFEERLAALGPEDVCLDLGANMGDFTELMAARAGLVHAFEPDPYAFSELERRFAGRRDVVLHRAAIGVSDGVITMRRDPGFERDPRLRSQGTSIYRSLLWAEGEGERFETPLVDLRRFLRELGQPVALMKMDIEGAEADVLEALLDAPELARIGAAFVETHEAQMPALRSRLHALRARIARLETPCINLDWH